MELKCDNPAIKIRNPEQLKPKCSVVKALVQVGGLEAPEEYFVELATYEAEHGLLADRSKFEHRVFNGKNQPSNNRSANQPTTNQPTNTSQPTNQPTPPTHP